MVPRLYFWEESRAGLLGVPIHYMMVLEAGLHNREELVVGLQGHGLLQAQVLAVAEVLSGHEREEARHTQQGALHD